jgi:hypothetical protein
VQPPSRRPVFDRQSRYAFEFSLVGHEGETGGVGVGSDPEVVVADRLPCPLQSCADDAMASPAEAGSGSAGMSATR